MKYRDMNGSEIHLGDIVENHKKRIIGQVVVDINGHVMLRMWKRWNSRTMNYEPITFCGPMEAYDRPLIPRKSKFWWWRNGYCVPEVEILQYCTAKERRPRKIGIVTFDAPIPGI